MENKVIDDVLQKIRSQELTMHSKTYFRLKIALLCLVTFFILVTSIFLLSFILFGLRIGGQLFLFGFGLKGVFLFLLFFPWKLLATDIVLVVFLELLLRRFRFGYKSSKIYLVLGVLTVTVASAFFIDRVTSLNDGLFKQTRHQEFPLVGNPYDQLRIPRSDRRICHCIVTAISGDTLTVVRDEANATGSQQVLMSFNIEGASSTIKVGDKIFIVGEQLPSGEIRTVGFRKVPVDYFDDEQ